MHMNLKTSLILQMMRPFGHCCKILHSRTIICAQWMKTGKCFCSLFPCPVLCNHTIDERLAIKGKKTPTAVPCHCLTGLLEVSGPHMFTKLKLSACHWLPDGRRCYVTDIRKTTKLKPLFFSSEGMRGWGALKSGRSMRRGGGDASRGRGSLMETDVLDSSCTSHMSSMSI